MSQNSNMPISAPYLWSRGGIVASASLQAMEERPSIE